MSYLACETLLRKDMKLEITKRKVQQCYALSKQIVVNEQEKGENAAYDQLSFIEFLEFIARVSEMWFEETEMEDLPLHVKLDEFLVQLLALIDAEIVR